MNNEDIFQYGRENMKKFLAWMFSDFIKDTDSYGIMVYETLSNTHSNNSRG